MKNFLGRNWRLFFLLALLLVLDESISTVVKFHSVEGNFPLRLRWTYEAVGTIRTVALSSNGITFINTPGLLIGLETQTGKVLWSVKIHSDSEIGVPVSKDGIVYFSNKSLLLAIDEQTGDIIWQVTTDEWSDRESWIVDVSECCVYVDTVSYTLAAYDKQTGKFLWDVSAGRGYSKAQALDGVVYLGDDRLHAIDEVTGEVLWDRYDGSIGDMIMVDGKLYYQEFDFTFVKLDVRKNSVVWDTSFWDRGQAALSETGNYLLVLAPNRTYALDARIGKLLWRGDYVGSDSAVIGAVAYIFDRHQQIVTAIDLATGNTLGKVRYGLPGSLIINNPISTVDADNGWLVVGVGATLYGYSEP